MIRRTLGNAPRTKWRFKGEDGASWIGESRVETVDAVAGKYRVLVRVARAEGTAASGARSDWSPGERCPG